MGPPDGYSETGDRLREQTKTVAAEDKVDGNILRPNDALIKENWNTGEAQKHKEQQKM